VSTAVRTWAADDDDDDDKWPRSWTIHSHVQPVRSRPFHSHDILARG